jgi:hypothetical protein
MSGHTEKPMATTETVHPLVQEEPRPRVTAAPIGPALPALVVVGGFVVGLTAAHGGYFPTSWGLGATLLLWATGLWLVLSGRTDAGRLDLLYLGLLGALTCWIGLSIAWSVVPPQSVLELERTVVLLSGVAAVLVLSRRQDVPRLCGVLLAAITAVCTYALATRLFPERLGTYDPIAGYRLSEPIGYWNTLGIFAAMGALLAVGVIVDARARWARASAAASLVFLLVTLYYTYSRGAWLALGIGFAILIAASPRRLRTVAAASVAGGPAAIGLLLASRPYALTHADVRLAQSSADGHRLAPFLVLLAVIGAALVLLLDLVEARVAVPWRVRLAIGAALLASVVIVGSAVVAHEGGPIATTRHAWRSFSAPPHENRTDLNKRLFSFSGNGRVDLWRAARAEYVAHRLTGGGAGTFERTWQARSEGGFKARDAHSLYVETLAELGPFGLALLVAFLLVPVGAALAGRRKAFLPALLAAYAAFLVHAGVDWDWEVSGATLTALLVGSVAVIALRGGEARLLGAALRTSAVVLALLASLGTIVAFLGNGALGRAQNDVAAKSYANAVTEANRARRLMPWSPWPLIARGDAQFGVGDRAAAARSYRHAISIDPGEWRGWLGLAFATHGSARARALAKARSLYPTSAEISEAAARLKDETNG